jgi:DNA/RNA endonuclease G (NUC1)
MANRGDARKAELTIAYGKAAPIVLTISQPEGEPLPEPKPEEDPKPEPEPEPTPDPTPDPTPTPSGNTLVAGWAELPTTIEKSNWHYTYHITDVKSNGKNARNYSVCYSSEKMCAIWVAAPMHDFYATKNTSRQDNYTTDPNFSFTQPGKWSGYTRGHLLGSAERLVSRKANDQVFYYSNIAPQHSTYFNTGGGAWNTLEEWVDKQWVGAADTTYQVIGCYWDPAESPKQVSGTTIPTHYYKVLLRTKNHKNKWVVECTKDELQCIAVMVEHRTYEKSEVPKPADYEKKGMFLSVKEMEELTGLTFFGNVPNAPKESYNVSDWTF